MADGGHPPWPIAPTYIYLKHRGVVRQEGIVKKIEYQRIEYAPPAPLIPTLYDDPALAVSLPDARTVYTFWFDYLVISVSPEDGWTWEIRETVEEQSDG